MGIIAITTAHSGTAVALLELDARHRITCAAIRDDRKPCEGRARYVTLDTNAPVCRHHTEPGRKGRVPCRQGSGGMRMKPLVRQ